MSVGALGRQKWLETLSVTSGDPSREAFQAENVTEECEVTLSGNEKGVKRCRRVQGCLVGQR